MDLDSDLSDLNSSLDDPEYVHTIWSRFHSSRALTGSHSNLIPLLVNGSELEPFRSELEVSQMYTRLYFDSYGIEYLYRNWKKWGNISPKTRFFVCRFRRSAYVFLSSLSTSVLTNFESNNWRATSHAVRTTLCAVMKLKDCGICKRAGIQNELPSRNY